MLLAAILGSYASFADDHSSSVRETVRVHISIRSDVLGGQREPCSERQIFEGRQIFVKTSVKGPKFEFDVQNKGHSL